MSKQITYDLRHTLPDKKATCIFNHIDKCAGTSLHSMLKKHFSSSQGVQSHNILNTANFNQSASFYYSHHLVGIEHVIKMEKFYYITFLRHPLARKISKMNYLRTEFPLMASLEKRNDVLLFTDGSNNDFIEYLGNGDKYLAEDNLFNNYVFFGITEHYNDSIKLLSKYIQGLSDSDILIKNATAKKDMKLSPLALEYFNEKNRDDIELYEKALCEFKKRTHVSENTENVVEDIRPSEKSVNKKEHSYAHIVQLFEKILCNKHFDSIYSNEFDFEIELLFCFYSIKETQSFVVFCNWLMERVELRPACIVTAYKCALKANMPELHNLLHKCFQMLEDKDPLCKMQFLVLERLEIIRVLASRKLWKANDNPKESFDTFVLNWLKKLEKQATWEGKSLFAQGLLYESVDNYKGAACLVEKALQYEPKNDKYYRTLFRNLRRLGNEGLNKINNLVQEGLAKNPQCEWALQEALFLAKDNKDTEQILLAAQRALAKNPYWRQGLNTLMSLLAERDSEKALDCAHKLSALDAQSLEAYLQLCQYFLYLKKYDEALHIIDTKAKSKPECAPLYMSAAHIMQEQGRHIEAIKYAKTACEADPLAVQMRVAFAKLLIQQGKSEEVKERGLQDTRSFSMLAYPYAYVSLAFEAQKDMSKALEFMHKAIEKQPEKITFLSEYARLLRMNEDFEALQAFCEGHLEKDEKQAWAWKELCYVFLAKGDKQKAKHMGQKSLKAYKDVEFEHFLQRLD